MSRLPLEIDTGLVGAAPAIDGVLACDDAVPRLLRRMLADDDATLARLRGVVGDRLLVVIGSADALPWVDGVRYVARAPDEPNLLLPTDARTRLSPTVVLRAFAQRGDAPRPPLLLLPERQRVVSLAEARPLVRARLVAALEASRG